MAKLVPQPYRNTDTQERRWPDLACYGHEMPLITRSVRKKDGTFADETVSATHDASHSLALGPGEVGLTILVDAEGNPVTDPYLVPVQPKAPKATVKKPDAPVQPDASATDTADTTDQPPADGTTQEA